MEMMPMAMMMELEELPQPFHLPFQDLSDMEFSTPLPPQLIYRNPPPLTLPSPTFSRGTWLQQKPESVEAMREMMFRMAALQPVQIDPESVKPPKRRNVKISKDPQSVAARHRRERISERIRILQRLVPGGTKMDTASMLDEAAHYMKFLKKQVQSLEQAGGGGSGGGMPTKTSTINHHAMVRVCGQPTTQAPNMLGSMELLR